MNSRIQDSFNDQINYEMLSSNLYLSMSAYFEAEGLPGMANWMRLQAQEEMMHAMKMYHFVIERDGRVILKDVPMLGTEWDSPLHAFEESLKHERLVTERINKMVDLAIEERDHATNIFLQWFVTEQVEEESSVKEIIDKLNFVKDNPVATYMIDKELGGRAAAPAQ